MTGLPGVLSRRIRQIRYRREGLSACNRYPCARSRERAIEAAKKRFARLEGIRDWRDHARIIEVSTIDDDPPLGVSHYR